MTLKFDPGSFFGYPRILEEDNVWYIMLMYLIDVKQAKFLDCGLLQRGVCIFYVIWLITVTPCKSKIPGF